MKLLTYTESERRPFYKASGKHGPRVARKIMFSAEFAVLQTTLTDGKQQLGLSHSSTQVLPGT